jgi:undecaprenyl diphosphate synthase
MRSPLFLEKSVRVDKKDQIAEVPQHVGIVMDGNRRWAKMRSKSPHYGHLKGTSNVEAIVEAAADAGVKILTLFVFSTENWKRSKGEVGSLMYLIQFYLQKIRNSLIQRKVRFGTIGDLASLPEEVRSEIALTVEATKGGDRIQLILAIGYGGRDDIRRSCIRACQKLVEEGRPLTDLTEKMISDHTDTRFLPDPDLIIRTGGTYRISNFLLWQASYSEFYVIDELWPDFKKEHLLQALTEYQNREKNWGK